MIGAIWTWAWPWWSVIVGINVVNFIIGLYLFWKSRRRDFNGLLMTEFFNLLSLNNMGANYMFNFQQLFIGFLIIVLANVFDYGSYLQEDHDMTV